ncbi:phosphogluconate dehydratase [Vibrio astriarenae]|nr:phosphogluconate dehydratase [Vibrio sp. C7]
MTHSVILDVTHRLLERSKNSRAAFLARTQEQLDHGKTRAALTCGNLAHAVAASCSTEKKQILDFTRTNVALVTSYNDMLSAHQPYQTYPNQIKQALSELGHTAQVAGGVPAMCDGVTQGQAGWICLCFLVT